jgi:hypothetical protein
MLEAWREVSARPPRPIGGSSKVLESVFRATR